VQYSIQEKGKGKRNGGTGEGGDRGKRGGVGVEEEGD